MAKQAVHPLEAVTHLDGRNGHKVISLSRYFSELAWMRYRIQVMADYLIFLNKEKLIPPFDRKIDTALSVADGERIWEIERTVNHDLRALEIFFKNRLQAAGIPALAAYVNLGIGSEDINNVALRRQIGDAFGEVLLPEIVSMIRGLVTFTQPLLDVVMLARTHGQPASVTTLGKELALFVDRLLDQLLTVKSPAFAPKFSGEVGNFNALKYTFPHINWPEKETKFLRARGFTSKSGATQIPAYEDLIGFFDSLKRINQILVGFVKDIWLYASFGYFRLVNRQQEAGSAGMPHKVNPQYFEGAEGGLETANACLEFFARKFSYSRLQRDFSDSTVRRNIVFPFTLSLLSYQSITTGLSRLTLNPSRISADLEAHWEVLSEVLTTQLKVAGVADAYDRVRQKMKGKVYNRSEWTLLVDSLPLTADSKRALVGLTPADMRGEAGTIGREILQRAASLLQKDFKTV